MPGNEWLQKVLAQGATVPATIAAFTDCSSSVQGVSSGANRRLLGWAITENASVSAEAKVFLTHGGSDGAPLIAPIGVDAARSGFQIFENGIAAPNGVWISVQSGRANISLLYKDFWAPTD